MSNPIHHGLKVLKQNWVWVKHWWLLQVSRNFLTCSCRFLHSNYLFQLAFKLYWIWRNLQKSIMIQKSFWPLTVWINCYSDLRHFANSRHSAWNFQTFFFSINRVIISHSRSEWFYKILVIWTFFVSHLFLYKMPSH